MTTTNRRQFLQSALATTAGLSIGGAASAIEPVRRTGKSRIRLSIAAYSYREYLNLKKPTMTLDDFIDLAAQMDLDAVEPTAYYFAQTTPDYLNQLKGHCTRLGLDVSGTAVGNDFCVGDPGKLKEQIASVKQWVEITSRLGGKTIRIFAGKVPKGGTEDKSRAQCIEAIQEACDYAGKYGVYLALENHGGIVTTINQMLSIVQAVQHPWFGVNFDTGNFHSADPYADLEKLARYAVVAQIKSEIHREGKPKEQADLKRLLDILRTANFRGYVSLEYEAATDPKTEIPKLVEQLKTLIRQG